MGAPRGYGYALAALGTLAALYLVPGASEPVDLDGSSSKPDEPLALLRVVEPSTAFEEESAERAVPAQPHAEHVLTSANQVVLEHEAEQNHGSHPITPTHEHMRYTQQLLGALNDALDLADPARMRELIDRYDEAEPDDIQQLREGYERIADCLQATTTQARADTRANAQRYYDEARASTLRRSVRRHCLER